MTRSTWRKKDSFGLHVIVHHQGKPRRELMRDHLGMFLISFLSLLAYTPGLPGMVPRDGTTNSGGLSPFISVMKCHTSLPTCQSDGVPQLSFLLLWWLYLMACWQKTNPCGSFPVGWVGLRLSHEWKDPHWEVKGLLSSSSQGSPCEEVMCEI